MQRVTTVGLDLAKNVFRVHAIETTGQVVVRRKPPNSPGWAIPCV